MPNTGCRYVLTTNLLVPAGPSTTTFPKGIPVVVAQVSTVNPLIAFPPASVDVPFPNLMVWADVTFKEPLVAPVTVNTLEAVLLACGSIIVSVPPVKFTLVKVDGFKLIIGVDAATLFAATPPALPSILISPPD